MMSGVKSAVVKLFNAAGLEVRRVKPATPARASMAGGLAQDGEYDENLSKWQKQLS